MQTETIIRLTPIEHGKPSAPFEPSSHLRVTLVRGPFVSTVHAASNEATPALGPAYVAGLRHPQIYCASDLASQLDPMELRAVLLHERHHQIAHAPALLVLLDAVAWPLVQLEVGRRWVARVRAQIEIAADRYAVASGATRANLASALVKLGEQNVPSGAAGYSASSELRFRALLDDAPDLSRDGSSWIASGVVAGAVLLVCLLI